ncbi:MAG: NAD(P)H-hydrate dehydratase [Gammaproteobacteria bacterium]|nr:NAD(P)H-hydrate dehydratase [Gammaproteobacteria bacterium]
MSNFTTRLPKNLYRAEQVRELDRIAIEEKGIAGFKLMQAAAAAAFNALREQWPHARHLIVFVGNGNNGGDGYVVAALAKEAGLGVDLIQVADSKHLKRDAKLAFELAKSKQVAMHLLVDSSNIEATDHAHTIVVDALLGTGIDRDVSGDYRSAIERINAMTSPVLAIDIPSGLNADTGRCMGTAIEADLTVSFIGMKQGLLTAEGRDFAGEIVFDSLEVPDDVYSSPSSPKPAVIRIDINDATRHLLPRRPSSHKGSHGHVVVVGGDYGFGGAVLMAAEAAQRAGSGLVSVITRSQHRSALLSRRPEIMVLGTEDDEPNLEALLHKASVIVIGPGLGSNKWSRQLLQMALSAQQSQQTPLIVDADGLNLLAERVSSGAAIKRNNWILTPHPGEAAALLNCSIEDVLSNRFAAVRKLTGIWGGACLLKGSGSLVNYDSDNGIVYLCTEGNAGMATGGMGDVLSGIAASLVGQGMGLNDALCCAVCIHGEAADLALENGGERGMIATDLFPYIRQLVNPIL